MSAKVLQLGPTFFLPATQAATSTVVVYGNRGMGKTNLSAVIAEEFASNAIRFSLIDPVGVSWGLRHGADGKGKGIDLLILGGRHADLGIEPTGGKIVADLVVDEHVNTLIDISSDQSGTRWSPADKARFVADYAERLLARNGEKRRPIMLMIDEAARFAPQIIEVKGKDSDVLRAKVAIDTIVEEGRNSGVGLTMITQRSARMAKSVSELSELMIAFRTTGPNSVAAVTEWLGAHVPRARINEHIEILRKLPRGQALAVSPGWLDFEGVVAIRLRRTFDSSRTPTGTEQRLSKSRKPVDLDRYAQKIVETIERADQSDPTKLRLAVTTLKRERDAAHTRLTELTTRLEEERAKPKGGKPESPKVGELRQQLARHVRALEAAMRILVKVKAIGFNHEDPEHEKAMTAAIAEAVKNVSAPIRKQVGAIASRVDGIKAQAEAAEQAIRALLAESIDLTVTVEKREPYMVTTPAAKRVERPPSDPEMFAKAPHKAVGEYQGDLRMFRPDGQLRSHVAKLLNVFGVHEQGLTREQALILAGLKPSGDVSTAFAALAEHEILGSDGKKLRPYLASIAHFGPFQPLPTGEALRALRLGEMPSHERKILAAIFAIGQPASRAEILGRAGLKPSGDVSTAFAKFSKLGWTEERDGGIAATAIWFDE